MTEIEGIERRVAFLILDILSQLQMEAMEKGVLEDKGSKFYDLTEEGADLTKLEEDPWTGLMNIRSELKNKDSSECPYVLQVIFELINMDGKKSSLLTKEKEDDDDSSL